MAYAEIRLGNPNELRIDGVRSDLRQREYDHMAMESWGVSNYDAHSMCRRWTKFEWVEPSQMTLAMFSPLGKDVQPYRVSWGVGDDVTTRTWLYACGDIKERVERDFDALVAPAIIREVPQSLPKRKVLKAHGLRDPYDADFVWPRWPDRETPPCIELRHGTARSMPIEAVMPFTFARGSTNFECRMRYGENGALKKAECVILRREQWNIDVVLSPRGVAKVKASQRVA